MVDDDRPPSRRAPGSGELSFGGHVVAFFKELVVVVVIAVVVAALLRGFIGQKFVIPSPSMQNTLQPNDQVLVEKLSNIARGQVVVFSDPGDWLTGTRSVERGQVGRFFELIGILPDTSTEHLIKRVVGMPGDRVVCCDSRHRITVNGQVLDEVGYLYPDSPDGTVVSSTIAFDVVVPEKHLFVLGDNREHSRDSRCHLNDVQAGVPKGQNAFVPVDLVVGRAAAVVWPMDRWHRLPAPDTFGAVPAAELPAPGTPKITAGPEATC